MTLDTINSAELRNELLTHPVIVISHMPCPDGMASAVTMRCFLASLEEKYDLTIRVEYFEGRHATAVRELPNVKDAVVFVLDFSYPRDVLEAMNRDAKRLIVLDHHKSAQKALAGLPYCEFDMERSGARMTFDFLSKHIELHEDYQDGLPTLVDYIQDRDLWRHQLENTKFVNAYLSTLPLDLHSEALWMLVASEVVSLHDMVLQGGTIRMVIEKQVNDYMDFVYVGQLLGQTELVPIVNVPPYLASEVLNALLRNTDFAYAVGWFFDGTRYHYSLRSKDRHDCSALAKRFKGGGHANAAGFSSLDLMVDTFDSSARADRLIRNRQFKEN